MVYTILSVVIAVLAAFSYLRWVRVAQLEHYGSGRVFAIARLWLRAIPINMLPFGVIVLLSLVFLGNPLGGLVPAVWWLTWPTGMGRLSFRKIAWTSRLKRLLGVVLVIHVAAALFLGFGHAVEILPLLTPAVVEVGLIVTRPIEAALGSKWQKQAAATLHKVDPRVVAITGSYGKTSTKNYAAHLIAGRWETLASPASFNNAMGLSRTVNERLTPGTDVFVAEMGIYGPGEITQLTRTFPPEVAAITTIGEAHLERMKHRDVIARAKLEIAPPAKTLVLNVDVPELAEAADKYASEKRVIRVSTTAGVDADVRLVGSSLTIDGVDHEVSLPAEVGHPINVAVAVGLALAVDVPVETILARLSSLPETPHRAEVARREDGLTVIDDTFNSNPDGAAGALAKAERILGEGGTLWTITPGMVELGHQQRTRNAEFAQAATATEHHRLCVVGYTNRVALLSADRSRSLWFASRDAAAAWVMDKAQPTDVVLYENDLPDHYA